MLFERTKHWKNIYASMDTFIGRHHRTDRSQPLFPIRLWNQSERTENGISWNYNKVKGWHNAFVSFVGGNHPKLTESCGCQNWYYTYAKFPETTRPVYNQINRQFIELMERCDTIPIITLLEQISVRLSSPKQM
ncbi:hypothetical protein HZS_3446 [Henneguya salminicola]|nr:hypothetical protein HZS_3446 [Henneguya salminicola]